MVDAIAVNSANRSWQLRPPTGQAGEHGRGWPVQPRLRRIRAWSKRAGEGRRVLRGEYPAGVGVAGKCLGGGTRVWGSDASLRG